jgi:hypothetical protein
VTSLVRTDRTASQAASALFSAPAVATGNRIRLAAVDNSARAVIINFADSTRRTVSFDGSVSSFRSDTSGQWVLPLDGGFLAIWGGNALWIPDDGPEVRLGPADQLLASGDRSEAFLVTNPTTGSVAARLFVARTGTVSDATAIQTFPAAGIDGQLVRGVPGSFAGNGGFELFDLTTRKSRIVDVDSPSPQVATTLGHEVLWYDDTCFRERANCELWATNIDSGRTRAIDVGSTTGEARGVGSSLYVRAGGQRMLRVDMNTLTVSDVPQSDDAQQFFVTDDGGLVFDSSTGIQLWQPGWRAPDVLTGGNFSENGLAIAVR